jgi:AcrR family transcriptional regulator
LAIVSEHGYGHMSVARVTGRAGVSRRTFYDLFEDREDCFLAAFNEVVGQVTSLMGGAYRHEVSWRERVRTALAMLLRFIDEEPGVSTLLIIDALKAGPRVSVRRAELVRQLSDLLHGGGSRARSGRELPGLVGEGVIGAVFSVVHTRLQEQQSEPLIALLNPLMGMIVLPYLGAAAAQRELDRPAPDCPPRPREGEPFAGAGHNPLARLPMRLTYRTLRVLAAIAERPGASNRAVADAAGVSDQGQMSRLLARLERLGLVENTAGGQPSGEPNEWRLTQQGAEIERVIQSQSEQGSTQAIQGAGVH